MEAKLEFTGTELIIHVPVEWAHQAKIDATTAVNFRVEEDAIVVQRKRYKRRKYTLEELASQITDENRHDEVDWGPPMGREVW